MSAKCYSGRIFENLSAKHGSIKKQHRRRYFHILLGAVYKLFQFILISRKAPSAYKPYSPVHYWDLKETLPFFFHIMVRIGCLSAASVSAVPACANIHWYPVCRFVQIYIITRSACLCRYTLLSGLPASVDIHSCHPGLAVCLYHTQKFPSITFIKRSMVCYKI